MSGSAPEPRPSVSSRPMWIFTGASHIWSCWMSVLTATNSTPVIPASIIRSSAFSPAPPMPTTRMTARYAGESGRGAAQRRGGCSGSGSTQRVSRSSTSGSGVEVGGASASGSTSRPACQEGASVTSGGGGGGATAAGGSSTSGSRSGVNGSGSGVAAGFSSPSLPACSACRWAASVARKSSASGPSRMLARLRAIEHLLRELAVRLGGGPSRIVFQDGGPLDRGLRVANGLADPGLEDEIAEVLLEDLQRLARVQRAAVVHGRKDSLDPDVRVQVLANHAQRVLQLHEPAQGEVLALHGDDHAGRGDERVDRQQSERGRRVDDDEVVGRQHRRQRLLEGALPADHARQRELGAGEVDRRDSEVDLAVVEDLLEREPVDEHVVHRALDRVRVQALAHRQVALRIEIERKHLVPRLGERDGEIQRRRRLRYATFLVGERDDPGHTGSFRGRPVIRALNVLYGRHRAVPSAQASRVLLEIPSISRPRATACRTFSGTSGSARAQASASCRSARTSASRSAGRACSRWSASMRSSRARTRRASSISRR